MIIDLGLVGYSESYLLQKELVAKRKSGQIGDSLILLEHYPVFTIGRMGKIEHLLIEEEDLRAMGIRILRVDRGGDITFHGPGQLVAYPIIDLKKKTRDLRWYMSKLEETAVEFLKIYSAIPAIVSGKTGVWVDGAKIASIGIGASDWVTYHGLSINVNVDLSFFSMIYPCGLKGIETTSLAKVLGRGIDMNEAREMLVSSFNKIFALGYECHRREEVSLLA